MSLSATASRFLGKAKTYLAENGEQVEGKIDKIARTVDQRTKGQHQAKIDKGSTKLKELVRSQAAKSKAENVATYDSPRTEPPAAGI
jgi:hypothetical protein